MKHYCLTFLLLLSAYGFSQNRLPVIKANAKTATIQEVGQPLKKWNLSPEIKIDVFTTNKLVQPVTVKFKTDIDSISFKLKPGQQKDFIVLLNGKDSCYTRIQSPEVKNFRRVQPEVHDTIPFAINKHNTNSIKVVLNKMDTLNLNFDSGATEVVLIEEALKNKVKSKLDLYNTLHDIKVGSRTYQSKVYDIQLAGHGVDGLLGWDNFDGYIVELNYDKNIMVVHSKLPKAVKQNKAVDKFKMKYFNQVFYIEGRITQGRKTLKDWFMFDTGYQKTAVLDNDLLNKSKFPVAEMAVIRTDTLLGIMKNKIPVVTSKLESLKIGKHELKNVPAQILTTNKPVRGANVHILGSDVLKRFNTFFDFQENVVYLLPNQLYEADYIEKAP
ncbi:aspartyl protease family protein [Flavobacterium sp. WV_118_3]|uniref:aspartyl protease family protein n=1 Tax=Flavobacterium sp. WV_118_3 TaxID=3151764 RepID=UPI00321A6DE4